MDTRLIAILVCPVCKGPLQRPTNTPMLICPADRLGFPIRDGIPLMLESEAIPLDHDGNPLTSSPVAPEVG